ncbi:MAG: hypothetical protein JZU65_17610 [Chlorobium sp.]|nr:hypothetical protein [Chlorobium sp.]
MILTADLQAHPAVGLNGVGQVGKQKVRLLMFTVDQIGIEILISGVLQAHPQTVSLINIIREMIGTSTIKGVHLSKWLFGVVNRKEIVPRGELEVSFFKTVFIEEHGTPELDYNKINLYFFE